MVRVTVMVGITLQVRDKVGASNLTHRNIIVAHALVCRALIVQQDAILCLGRESTKNSKATYVDKKEALRPEDRSLRTHMISCAALIFSRRGQRVFQHAQ
jgi:hypothetical protein